MAFFFRGALPRTPLGAPPPDPRVRCQKVRVRLRAENASKRPNSKKIAMYICLCPFVGQSARSHEKNDQNRVGV